MFDLATRPAPAATAGALAGTPFDLRLARPTAAASVTYTEYVNAAAIPQAGVQVLQTWSVALEDSLATAIVLSLFTDRRATDDDMLPRGVSDRRGWVGDEFMGAAGDAWGSGLWLLRAGKVGGDVLEQARFEAQEALAWLVRDGIAERVDVTAQWVGDRGDVLAVRPTIWQAGQSNPVYDVLWGTSIRRQAAGDLQ